MSVLVQIRSRYNALTPREQRVVQAAGLALAVIVLYALVWLPAARNLPTLEAQRMSHQAALQTLQAAAAEAPALQTARSALSLKANPDLAMLRASLNQVGIDANSVELQLEGTNGLRLGAAKVNARSWLNWLALVQREYALSLREAQMTPVNVGGATGGATVIKVTARLSKSN
jgi:general secretion pathway protein M